jgi:HSP90 family molecular chaperone
MHWQYVFCSVTSPACQSNSEELFLQALDKIRFEGLTDKSKLDAQPELFIHIVPDKTSNTLSIIDSGIGMTKAGK